MFNPQAVQQRVDAYQNNPQALMQKYAMSQELLDLLALQQIQKQKQDAARQMAMQMGQGGQPPTVADQVEKETFDMTRQDLAQKLAPVAQAQQMQQPGPAQQGIAANPAPNISRRGFAGGGIVAFKDGGDTEDALDKQRESDRARLRALVDLIRRGADKAGRAIADVATLPIRGVAGAYDTAVVRPMRAAGVDAAYLSPLLVPEGADASSMTPFYDLVREPGQNAPSAEESPAAPELMLSAPGPGGRERRTAEIRKGTEDEKEERGDGRTSAAPERMLAAQPQGLESLLDQYLRGELGAKPDYSQADEYGRLVTDPLKDIQRRRMEEGARREQEAAQLLEQRMAGMQPQKDRWRRVLEGAAANMDVSKPFGGLQGLAAAGGTVDEADAARAEKEALLRAEHAKTVAALRDAGFGFEEAMIKADELLFGKRTEADKAAAERRAAGAEGVGEEVRSRRTAQTQMAIENMRERARSASEKAADARASTAERTAARQEIALMIKTLSDQLAKPGTMLLPEMLPEQKRIKDEINMWKQELVKLGGYEPSMAGPPPKPTGKPTGPTRP